MTIGCIQICFRNLVFLCLVVLASVQCFAQEDESKSELTASEKLIQESLTRYKLFGDKNPEPLKPLIVLSWNNPIAGSVQKCQTVLFIGDGQPKAAACIWMSSSNRLYHEFGPLCRGPLSGKLDGKEVWAFAAGSRVFKEIPEAEAPAPNRLRRLLQMKQLIRRFSATELRNRQGEAAKVELRLLAKPLYRYEKESRTVLDGALFCFADTTDPEAIVIIEAVRDGDKRSWEYAFARRTTLPVEGHLDGETVWSTEQVGYDAFNQIRYR